MMLRGVSSVLPGYSGGTKEDPTYEEVCSGKTGHAEVAFIEYDPDKVSYQTLLTVFFGSHDPTTLDRQGADVGTQYRSVIFFTTKTQQEEAIRFIQDINGSNSEGARVVTEVVPFTKFYAAEDYHKNYFKAHPENPYCEIVINPKLEKVKERFATLLKEI